MNDCCIRCHTIIYECRNLIHVSVFATHATPFFLCAVIVDGSHIGSYVCHCYKEVVFFFIFCVSLFLINILVVKYMKREIPPFA